MEPSDKFIRMVGTVAACLVILIWVVYVLLREPN